MVGDTKPPFPTSDLRCCQCGREGTSGFRVIPEAVHEPTGARVGPFIVCASAKACRKRWPREAEDRLDARLA